MVHFKQPTGLVISSELGFINVISSARGEAFIAHLVHAAPA